MGVEIQDRDWLVVGATPEQMKVLGFRQVGRNFPVFLHPVTGEQYALARTEKKVSPGYHGFNFDINPQVTLEQDLLRRDLTMNAMARDKAGHIVDPFNGLRDIKDKVIRHVSEAFREDPIRILRTARFAAHFSELGFTVATETLNLMMKMVGDGEVDTLVPERVWQELSKVLVCPHFSQFIIQLRDCGALKKILPEVDALFGIPQPAKYHPEVDTGIHTLMSLDAVSTITDDPEVMFAILVHDLGKAHTPDQYIPAHPNHETSGLRPIRQLCKRLGVPGNFEKFALKVCQFHLHGHGVYQLKPDAVLDLLEQLNAFRDPGQIEKFKNCCLADHRGRTGHEQDNADHLEMLVRYLAAALSVSQAQIAEDVDSDHYPKGRREKEIKRRIREARISAITSVKFNQGR